MKRLVRVSASLTLLMLLLGGCQCTKTEHPNTLLFTTRIQGSIEPCGCTADPLGGLSRLATLVKSYPGASFLDAGDLFIDPAHQNSCEDFEKFQLLSKVLNQLGFLGTLPASSKDFELAKKFGLPVLGDKNEIALVTLPNQVKLAVVQASLEKLEQLDLVAQADLIIWGQAPGSELYPPFQLKSGLWVFSAGLLGQYLGKIEFVNLGKKTNGPIKLDTTEIDLKNKRDLLERRIQALEEKPPSDFIKTRIELAKRELKELGSESGKEIQGAYMRFEAIPIKRDIKQDPAVQKLVSVYEQALPERLAACENQINCPKPIKNQAVYVGDQTCKVCHAGAYEFWQKSQVELEVKNQQGELVKRLSGHSKAWKTLEDANKTLDRNCIGCHSVGFMKPGGYCKAQDVGVFKNVQCESCHGPGSLHVASGDKTKIKREVSESHCRSCHHPPHIANEAAFNYHERLKEILGPGHGESLLKRLNHQHQ